MRVENILVFCGSMEIDLFCVWVVQIDLISVWGIEFCLKQCSDKMDLDVWVVEIELLYAGRKSVFFRMSMKIDLFFVWVV